MARFVDLTIDGETEYCIPFDEAFRKIVNAVDEKLTEPDLYIDVRIRQVSSAESDNDE